MNFDAFFDRVEENGLEISLGVRDSKKPVLLSNEALFQLPLISLIVLIMAKDRRKPYVSEIGRLVGESIEDSMSGFKGSSQHVGWSANLRVRTVKAISFLDYSKLIVIPNRKSRIRITDLGIKVVDRALKVETDLSYNLYQISKSYRNICVNKQLDLELE